MDISLTLFMLLAALITASSIRIVGENQRFAVYRLGRYLGLKGPGLVWKIPNIDKFVRLAIGDRGELVGTDSGTFQNIQVPVTPEGTIQVGSLVKITRFDKESIRVCLDSDQRRTIVCAKCGHANQI
jgi:regulator of protease activity HflC (stomatin/prohibitin superfamily)